MITKQEITAAASAMKLLPTTVEKDYVLSWILYGISQHSKLSQWLFKGGTCLKKCYFETYRFSEDLDFTVPKEGLYNKNEILNALTEVTNIVYQQVGIIFGNQGIEVKESINKQNNPTYIAKLTYSGPLGLSGRTQQRIKFDITNDEVIVDTPDIRAVFHPYSDAPNFSVKIACYSVNEILAEKTRAIYERQGRARDIYDIVNISRNFRGHVDIGKAKLGVREKFKFKSLPAPSVDAIFSRIGLGELKAGWEDQLRHQVQILPSVETFYSELRPALAWWMDNDLEPSLPAISNKLEERSLSRSNFPEIITQQAFVEPNAYHLNQIRYAARNRLCVEIEYDGVTRLVEPYSLRRPRTGNLLLYVYELHGRGVQGIKAYNISKITRSEIIQQSFLPRYAIEL